MVQIGKRKKKGRPPKVDLDRRVGLTPDPRPPPPRQVRRSTRRRSITYVDDFYDDSLDEEEEGEEEEEEGVDEQVDEEEDEDERREKKLKLVLKVANTTKEPSSKRVDSVSRFGHVSAPESSCSDDNKPFKKRKLDEDDDDEDEEEEEEEEEEDDDDDVRTVRTRNQKKNSKPNGVLQNSKTNGVLQNSKANGVSKRLDSVQTQTKQIDSSKGWRLPEKQLLEIILDKLQKKDTYGVYAEPVDPEELPDYHDVIEHPMDFGTVRKKLANGAYSTLEQFESDVDLICTNAMHYNAPETVYYKQARTIQELARKKFERLRVEYENPVEELKLDENVKPNPTLKKPIKKSVCKTIHEPVVSDFCSGATLVTPGDKCTLPNVTQAGGYEKPSAVDGQVDGNSSLTENKPEKTEEQLTGKGLPSKLGRKPFMFDENRRVTYNSSNQADVRSESMCTIFEGENVQLVSVGLHADHSYARSLARFAATLGPVAWRVASRKIEQAVPSGIKFGRGWVGEYEPLPTPVLMLENHTEKQTGSNWDAKSRKHDMTIGKSTKDEKTVVGAKVGSEPIPKPVQINESQMQWQHDKFCQSKAESGKQNFVERSKVHPNDMQPGPKNSPGLITSCKLQDTAKVPHFTNPISERKPGFFGLSGSKINGNYHQNVSSMKDVRSENMALKQVELHHSVSSCTNHNGIVPKKQPENNSEMTSSRLMEVVSRNRNLVQSAPYKPSESDGVASGRVPNGRGSSINNHVSSLSYAISSSQPPRAAMYFPHGNHRQGLSDPVQMMRMLADKNNNQQQSLNMAAIEGSQITQSDPSRRDDSSVAATTAARAWMTLGAAHLKPLDISGPPKLQIAASSLYNSAREVPHSVAQNCEEPLLSRVHSQSDNNKLPPQMFLSQPTRSGDESRFLNNRQMAFPQLVTTDLSRFQVQSPWQGLVPHAQQNKKHDTLPPDLNIRFQSPASPVKQSSAAMIDSQQPDLALQL